MINVSCSWTQSSDPSEAQTHNTSISSQAIYHWATVLHNLLFHLLKNLSSIYCKKYGSRSDCSFSRSQIRDHSGCCLDGKFSVVHLDICSISSKQTSFSGYENIDRIRVNPKKYIKLFCPGYLWKFKEIALKIITIGIYSYQTFDGVCLHLLVPISVL